MASIAQKYIACISQFTKDSARELFAPQAIKIVNSKIICHNRDEIVTQMQSVHDTYGIKKINVLEIIEAKDDGKVIVRFEISYNDETTESVISIIKFNAIGLISEINEVFGEKEIYQWQS